MHFFTFVCKNLLRRPARSLLTIVGLAVAVAAVVSLVGVSTGFERSFIGMYDERGVDLVVQRAGGGEERLNSGLPESLLDRLAQVPGVKQVLGGMLDAISFEDQGIYGVLINGWPAGSALYDRLTLLEGRELKTDDQHKAMLGRVIASKLGKKLGDNIELYGETFEVVGLYESPVVFENGAVLVLLGELQRLMNRPNEITGFTIVAEKPIDKEGLDALRKRIEAIQPGIVATPAADFVRGVNQIKISRAVAWLTSAIALIIGAIGMLNTMITSVFERTREIGTLRAIGWRKSRIVKMILTESVLLSLGGAVAGSAAGVALAKLLSTLPNTAGIIEGNVAAPVIAQGFAVALIVGIAGAIYPALWSANLLPTEALRRK